MEEVDTRLAGYGVLPVDAVYVYAALHHAFDWRETFRAVYNCLAPGGWFLICREPNVLHTFVSYRLAKVSNTKEIGFSRRELASELRKVGFLNLHIFNRSPGFLVKPHWMAAQK